MSGRDRLRTINGAQRPWSSIGITLYSNHNDHAPKRQKTSAQPENQSRYFSKTKKRHVGDIVDVEDLSKPDRELLHEGSQRDSISVTSGGNTVASTSALPVYRDIQMRMRKSVRKTRHRRSRAKKDPRSQDGKDAVDASTCSPERDPATFSRNNNDHLSTDPLSGDDPPPSNIKSDLMGTPKRAASGQYAGEGRAKRQKRISAGDPVSEDELTAELRASTGKKPSKFLSHSYQATNSKQRGDITRTDFRSVRPVARGQALDYGASRIPDLVLLEAAGGKHAFSASEDSDTKLKLRLDETSARVVGDSAQQFGWLEIMRPTVQILQHKATISPFVQIKRSQVNGAPAQLVLRFADASEPAHLLHWLGDSSRKVEKSQQELEQIFNNALKHANDYTPIQAQSSPPQPIPPKPSPRVLRDPFQAGPSIPRQKLKDKMKGDPEHAETSKAENAQPRQQEIKSPIAIPRNQGVETRRTRRSSPATRVREATVDRWTIQNPDWDKNWHKSLIYPATGRNRATVDKDDIPRLDEGEFLNDNLISFYLRYLQVQLETERPEVLQKVYFFNSFFFEKLRANRNKINYEGVRSWTAKVDLLSYDYIIVPVNENAHWYLAIIYNAPRMIPQPPQKDPSKESKTVILDDAEPESSPKVSPVGRTLAKVSLEDNTPEQASNSQASNSVGVAADNDSSTRTVVAQKAEAPIRGTKRKSMAGLQRFSVEEPRIVTLDSLGSAHSPTCRCLREYLVEEAKHKKNVRIINPPGGMTARGIPEQDNFCDCGVFVLGYMEHFLKDPDEAMRKLLMKEETGWDIKPSQIRTKVRNLIFRLQKEQQERLEEERRQKKRDRKAAKDIAAQGSEPFPSSPQVPMPSSQASPPNEGMMSPLTNGTSKRDDRDDQQTPKISRYFLPRSSPAQSKSRSLHRALQSSPGGPTQPRISDADKSPKVVFPLEDDSSQEVIPATNQGRTSTKSSPAKCQSRASVDLTKDDPTSSYSPARLGIRSPENFVKALSTSPTEARSTPSATQGADIKVAIRKNRSPKSPSKPQVVDLETPIMKSIENDEVVTTGARYNGVDRCIDLSSQE